VGSVYHPLVFLPFLLPNGGNIAILPRRRSPATAATPAAVPMPPRLARCASVCVHPRSPLCNHVNLVSPPLRAHGHALPTPTSAAIPALVGPCVLVVAAPVPLQQQAQRVRPRAILSSRTQTLHARRRGTSPVPSFLRDIGTFSILENIHEIFPKGMDPISTKLRSKQLLPVRFAEI
jgi:hypothetical protein